ncbi:hypothetical protein HHI36_008951 [Cryptolaemus montrouzieri]|uniref:Uncharacterized protein n=1 Tax=Cryptolaemus montrouzieri TaxID=559131 RepID=A0ABD2MU09_9CUCU
MEKFECYRNLEVTCYVCTKYYGVFHKSCSERDWQKRLIHIVGHKVLCCADKADGDKVVTITKQLEESNRVKSCMEKQISILLHEKELWFRKSAKAEKQLEREIRAQKHGIIELKRRMADKSENHTQTEDIGVDASTMCQPPECSNKISISRPNRIHQSRVM